MFSIFVAPCIHKKSTVSLQSHFCEQPGAYRIIALARAPALLDRMALCCAVSVLWPSRERHSDPACCCCSCAVLPFPASALLLCAPACPLPIPCSVLLPACPPVSCSLSSLCLLPASCLCSPPLLLPAPLCVPSAPALCPRLCRPACCATPLPAVCLPPSSLSLLPLPACLPAACLSLLAVCCHPCCLLLYDIVLSCYLSVSAICLAAPHVAVYLLC